MSDYLSDIAYQRKTENEDGWTDQMRACGYDPDNAYEAEEFRTLVEDYYRYGTKDQSLEDFVAQENGDATNR